MSHSHSSERTVARSLVPPLHPLPRRGYVENGQEIELLTNLFHLTTRSIKLYEYKVEFHELRPPRGGGGRGRGRGGRGGRGRGSAQGQPPKPEEVELKERELMRRSFWKALCGSDNFWKFVYDDGESAWSVVNVLGQLDTVSEIVEIENSDQKMIKVRVTLCPVSPYLFDLSGVDKATTDASQKFMKNLLTQRARLPVALASGGSPVCAKWETINRTIYAIPGKFPHLNRNDYEINITPGIRAWLGLYASIRQMEDSSPIVNWALRNRLFYVLDMDLLTFYIEVLQGARLVDKKDWKKDLEKLKSCGMNREQRDQLQYKITGLHVKSGGVDVNGQRRPAALIKNKKNQIDFVERHFKVIGVSDLPASTYKPWSMLTLEEEYNRRGQRLGYPYLPLIRVQVGKEELLMPMETLYIHRTQSFLKMDYSMQQAFIRGVCRSPTKYKQLIDGLVSETGLEDNRFMDAFGVSFDPKMIECKGKVLDTPILRDGEGKEVEVVEPIRFYKSKVLNQPVAETIVFSVAILVGPTRHEPIIDKKYAGKFYKNLVASLKDRGLTVDPSAPMVYPEVQMYSDDSSLRFSDRDQVPSDLRNKYNSHPTFLTLSMVLDHEKQRVELKKNCKLVVLIFTDRSWDFYGRIKTICEGERNVVGQVVDYRTVLRVIDYEVAALAKNQTADLKVYYSLATKINGKLGGVNIFAEHPASVKNLDHFDLNKTMYVGIDVTHPSPGSEIDISIASMVGSMDEQGSMYKYEIYAQMTVKENVECFDRQFKQLMLAFHKHNGFFAKHIIVYRDGVSNSEMLEAGATEMEWMRKSWRDLTDDPHNSSEIVADMPTFTYITVQKRHGTRFFMPVASKDGKESFENIPSGTTIDRKVVSPTEFDIWLASHHGEIGTSRPAHYYILHDELEFTAQQICDMTYRLCFLSARCRKPVSIPIPVFYAHLACEKAKEKYKSLMRDGSITETLPDRQKTQIEHLLRDLNSTGMSFV